MLSCCKNHDREDFITKEPIHLHKNGNITIFCGCNLRGCVGCQPLAIQIYNHYRSCNLRGCVGCQMFLESSHRSMLWLQSAWVCRLPAGVTGSEQKGDRRCNLRGCVGCQSKTIVYGFAEYCCNLRGCVGCQFCDTSI